MKRGFTLIEMLVVLVILSVLAGIAYPNYARHVVRIRRTEGQIALIEAMHRQGRYYQQHNSYFAFTSADGGEVAAQGFRWWSGAGAAVSAYELDAHACPGRDLAECVEVRATPGTAKVDSRFRDPECGALTLDSYDAHAAAGTGRCWP